MPSPFPGMNPYLEQPSAWHDFHQSAMIYMRELLTPQVRPKYFAQVESDLYIHEMPEDNRRMFARADVSVARDAGRNGGSSAASTLVAPARGRLPAVDELRHNVIEIRDRESRELVTVIELLSPTNKYASPDREQYLAKRHEILKSPANLVEIDLLRGGPRMPLEETPDSDYVVLVSRASERPYVDLWPISLQQRLPRIPIPLRDGDSDAELELQHILHQAYDAANYGGYIYNNPPQPQLTDEQQRWADEIIQAGTGR